MEPLLWPAILVLLGLLLMVLEVFVPSGGMLGFLSVASLVAGIGLAFYQVGTQVGFLFLGISAVAIPTVLIMAFRYWPETPLGRRMLPTPPTEEEVMPDSPERRLLRSLVGRTGRATTLMVPSGAIEIEDHIVNAVSEGMAIEAGQLVRVLEVRGNRVLVRPVAEGEEDEQQRTSPASQSDDVLSQPIDSLGFDPFDDPLA